MEFQSVEEVGRFEELFVDYHQTKGIPDCDWISLASAFHLLKPHPEGGRIFVSLLDLRFNVATLLEGLGRMALVRNKHRQIQDTLLEGGLLANPEALFERIDLLRANTGYILLYRAVLDKVMGVLVLLAAPSEYQSFIGSKSRQSKFKKIAEKSKLPSQLVTRVIETVEAFNKFRTPEAHGPGVARKWSFVESDAPESPQDDMYWSWNSLVGMLKVIGAVFDSSKHS